MYLVMSVYLCVVNFCEQVISKKCLMDRFKICNKHTTHYVLAWKSRPNLWCRLHSRCLIFAISVSLIEWCFSVTRGHHYAMAADKHLSSLYLVSVVLSSLFLVICAAGCQICSTVC